MIPQNPIATCLFLMRVENPGGAELSMLALAKGLRQKGYEVTFVTYGACPELISNNAEGMPTIDLAARRTRSAIIHLFRLMAARQPDVLVTALEYTNVIGIVAGRLCSRRSKIIVTCHNPLDVALRTVSRFEKRLLRLVIGLIYPLADTVVTVSQGIADEVRGMLLRPGQVKVIYNPVIKEKIPSSPVIPHPWLADSTTPVLMAIGRLNPVKDFATLLRAFALVAAARPVRLIVLGEGGERESLQALAHHLGVADQVLWPGFVQPVDAWLAHARLFVSASRLEGFGNAIVEAMHHGVPVVATDCPVGPAEILEQGRLGALVPVGDAPAMAKAILSTLDREPDRAALKTRAAAFSERRCVDSYAALIDELRLS